MSASISLQPAGEQEWTRDIGNRPLTSGDKLRSGKGAMGELQIGSTSIRMGSDTSLGLVVLDNHTTQVKVDKGSVIVRIRHLDDDDRVEIDLDDFVCAIRQVGEYRFDQTLMGWFAAVWKGKLDIAGVLNISHAVVTGQRVRLNAVKRSKSAEIEPLPSPDDFSKWAVSRDQRDDKADSTNYISPEITGYQDLDEAGHWSYVANYGPAWTPSALAPGWVPYRFGHWVWVQPWGWNWVEDESWGFAPFHYGRWALVNGVWFWVPGPVVVRPAYAPASVAFVKLGAVAGHPTVAWLPLAPGEVFIPWYQASRTYLNFVNITNTRLNVTRVSRVIEAYNGQHPSAGIVIAFENQKIANAVTAVPQDIFTHGGSAVQNISAIDQSELAGAAPTSFVPARPAVPTVSSGSTSAGDMERPAHGVERGLSPGETTLPEVVNVGPYYALVIGIDHYAHLPGLRTAVNDARAVASLLHDRYGFKTEFLPDATRSQIMTALSHYRGSLSSEASLLVYYAGHGTHDRDSDKIYWLPVDAERDNSANWLLTDDVTSEIRAIPARHVLVVADSCYAGGMTRDANLEFKPRERNRALQKAAGGKSRTLLTSGGDEPVADTGGEGGHSVFAAALLDGFRNMSVNTFTAEELYGYIKVPVAGNSEQNPEYNFIHNSGHVAGDFVFLRQAP